LEFKGEKRMRTLLDTFLLLLGFVLLIKSADVFVNASVEIAKKLKIPTVVIGLTVVAFGTSAPEAVIGISAALGGNSELAIANSVGADIFNILFIIGFCAAIYPISVKLNVITRDFWVAAGAVIFLLVMVVMLDGVIPRWGSFILLAGFLTYMFVVVRSALKNRNDVVGAGSARPQDHPGTSCHPSPEGNLKPKPLWRSILFAVLGAGLIVVGGKLTVFSAVNIATAIGVTERIIGLTVVAIGTSLPELVTTLIACRKGEGEFALGFIIGSSIFNIMFVLGVAGLIAPLTFESGVIVDVAVLAVALAAFYVFAKSRGKVTRVEGLVMALIYLGYMAWAILM